MNRFSDEQLAEFHEQFQEHIRKEDKRFDEILEATQANAVSIAKLVTSTHDVVEAHRDIQGAARIGLKLQKFVRWLVGVPIVGVGAYNIIMWVINHFPIPATP